MQTLEELEVRDIVLSGGGNLHISMTQEFKRRVREHFNLSEHEYISDDLIKRFFYGAFNPIVEEAEREE
jgi:predicted GIY-YIG superfamily endonuclease